MTDQFNDAAWWKDETVRRDAEIASLKEMLRLTNDKMAEQVRQARWEVADDALQHYGGRDAAWEMLERIRDANAPKD